MERLTKRVGCGEAVPVAEGDICAPFIKAGLCKTGSQGGPFGTWERHCNDACVLGMIIDKLAAYEDTGIAPEDVVSVMRCENCRDCEMCYPEKQLDKEATQAWLCKRYKRFTKPDDFCSYGERRAGE